MTEMTTPKIDLIWGCTAIAKEIERTPRQTFYLLESGALPARKIGNRWVAERGKLHALFLKDDAA
jgi:hypothetical protein